jgi:hypothetical protein
LTSEAGELPGVNVAGGIFISYRHDDGPAAAGRLFDKLEVVYPREQLFLDVVDIEPGLDFVEILTERIASCDVLIVIIGRNWLTATDESGKRRIDNSTDFVHLEIKTALERNVRTIPVLIDGATLPKESELPLPLKGLARRQATKLTHERFVVDAEELIKSLIKIVAPSARKPSAAAYSLSVAAYEDTIKSTVLRLANTMTNYSGVYVAPNIPRRKEKTAKEVWGAPQDEEFQILFDLTFFGSAKDFVAVSANGIFYRVGSTKHLISFYELRNADISDIIFGVKINGKDLVLNNVKAARAFLRELQRALQSGPGVTD